MYFTKRTPRLVYSMFHEEWLYFYWKEQCFFPAFPSFPSPRTGALFWALLNSAQNVVLSASEQRCCCCSERFSEQHSEPLFRMLAGTRPPHHPQRCYWTPPSSPTPLKWRAGPALSLGLVFFSHTPYAVPPIGVTSAYFSPKLTNLGCDVCICSQLILPLSNSVDRSFWRNPPAKLFGSHPSSLLDRITTFPKSNFLSNCSFFLISMI